MHLDEMDIQRNNLTQAIMNIFNLIVYQKDRPDYKVLHQCKFKTPNKAHDMV